MPFRLDIDPRNWRTWFADDGGPRCVRAAPWRPSGRLPPLAKEVRQRVNEIGARLGCASCRARVSGRRDHRHWTAIRWPLIPLAKRAGKPAEPQVYIPLCTRCWQRITRPLARRPPRPPVEPPKPVVELDATAHDVWERIALVSAPVEVVLSPGMELRRPRLASYRPRKYGLGARRHRKRCGVRGCGKVLRVDGHPLACSNAHVQVLKRWAETVLERAGLGRFLTEGDPKTPAGHDGVRHPANPRGARCASGSAPGAPSPRLTRGGRR